MRSIRWGILGCARISRRGLIPGIRGSRGGTIAAIASRERSTADAWAAEFTIPRAYGSYQAVLDDPEIDAVYIPLPNELHKPWTLAAADAGKHVLCEKPLAMDAAEAAAMADHCRARGVVLMEAFMWRHQPRTAELLRRVGEGIIGEVRLVRSSFSFPIDLTDWRLNPGRGGGSLFDVGTYGLSTARLFAGGEPSRIRSLGKFGPTGVDLAIAAAMEFPGGKIGQFDCSFEQAFRCEYEIVGTLGTINVPDAYLPPERPTATIHRPSGTETLTFDGRDQYACMVDAFHASVEAGTLVAPAEDGVAQMRAIEAILAASR